ncbi:MAG: hypothetical protein LBS25_08680 [Candidatus Symbiothrix sp.]|jgi:hypothetical protein|nr:hypothetical protein [Candidatus Symbiothrix sp.]
MSEELLQRDLIANPEKIGKGNFYNIGSTTVKTLKEHSMIRSIDYGKIEYKKPTEFNTKEKQEKARKQELEVAQKLHATLFIASNKQKLFLSMNTIPILDIITNHA